MLQYYLLLMVFDSESLLLLENDERAFKRWLLSRVIVQGSSGQLIVVGWFRPGSYIHLLFSWSNAYHLHMIRFLGWLCLPWCLIRFIDECTLWSQHRFSHKATLCRFIHLGNFGLLLFAVCFLSRRVLCTSGFLLAIDAQRFLFGLDCSTAVFLLVLGGPWVFLIPRGRATIGPFFSGLESPLHVLITLGNGLEWLALLIYVFWLLFAFGILLLH